MMTYRLTFSAIVPAVLLAACAPSADDQAGTGAAEDKPATEASAEAAIKPLEKSEKKASTKPASDPEVTMQPVAGPWKDNYGTERDASIANGAREFIIKRQGCDHFRGEEGYDEDRTAFLLKQMTELCAGTDVELKKLRTDYAGHAPTIKALSEFENCIEADTICEQK